MAPNRRNGGADGSSAVGSRPPRVSGRVQNSRGLARLTEALAREAALLGRGATPLLQQRLHAKAGAFAQKRQKPGARQSNRAARESLRDYELRSAYACEHISKEA